jgi:hypothetical protein
MRIAKLRRFFGAPDLEYPRRPLHEGEEIMMEDSVVFSRSFFAAATGRLTLTNRRIFWDETDSVLWPFKRVSGESNVSDIASVDKGTLFDFIGGGRRLRIRLRSGRDKCLWDAAGRLDEWIATIRRVISNAPADIP